MKLPEITMDRSEARRKFLEYRDAVKARHDEEDAAIMRGYRYLAQGKQLLNLPDTIRLGGYFPNGLPRIAICNAEARTCLLRIPNGRREPSVRFWADRMPNTGRPAAWRFVQVAKQDACPAWQPVNPAGWGFEVYRTQVPIIPPMLRPNHGLRNYHILWEVEEWTHERRRPAPPRDPALLRHLQGDLYAVLGVWDLTPLERAVLSERPQLLP